MYSKLMWPLWWAMIIVLCALSTMLAGCTTRIAGTAVPQREDSTTQPTSRSPSSSQAAGDAELAKSFAAARLVDPCALHDVAVAATVVGMPGDEIMPGGQLNTCNLDLSPTAMALNEWTLSASVGVRFGTRERQQASREGISGLTFYRPADLLGDDDTCRYLTALNGTDEQLGVELAVHRRSDTTKQTKEPCQIAQEYLRGVAKYWQHPALRTDRLTAPAITIGQADPCAALNTLTNELGGTVRVSMTEPNACLLMSGTAKDAGMLSGELAVETDPRPLLTGPSGKGYKAVTVAGRPGVANEAKSLISQGSTCSLTVVVDDEVSIQADQTRPDSPKSVQVAKTRADSCPLATKAAEALLAAVHQ